MAKEICISTTPHETRLAILEDDQLAEIYYERENEYTLAGSIYKGRVTRVLPGMQSSFVDVGLERDAFLYVTDFLEDQEDSEDYETSSTAGAPRRGSERQASEEAPTPAPVASNDERRGRREGKRGDKGKVERQPLHANDKAIERPEAGESAPHAPRVKASDERAVATAALRTAQPTASDREDKGDEETPQGTRRWRGRRGRRRGGLRVGVLGASAAKVEGEDAEGNLPQTAATPFASPEHGAPGGLAAPLNLVTEADMHADVGASMDAVSEVATDANFDAGLDEGFNEEYIPKIVNIQASAATQPAGESGRSRNRKERAPKERNRDRGQNRGLDQGVDQGKSPDHASDRSTHAGRQGSPTESVIVLPGESLSKYGSSPVVSSAALSEAGPAPIAKLILPTRPVNYVAPKPSTEVEVLAGWDGGSVLPGESLSRYKGQSAAPLPTGLDKVASEPDAATLMADGVGHHAQEHVESAFEAALEALPLDTYQQTNETVNQQREVQTNQQRNEEIETALAAATTTSPETVAEALPGMEHAESITTTAHPIDREEQTDHAIAEARGSEAASEISETGDASKEAELKELPPVQPEPADPETATHVEPAVEHEEASSSNQEAVDYEPADGAASVRLSPPTTNELRLSRFFGGGEPATSLSEEKKMAAAEPEAAQEPGTAPEASTSGEITSGEAISEEAISGESMETASAAVQGQDAARTTLEAGSESIPEMSYEDDALGMVPESMTDAMDGEAARIDRALSPAFSSRFSDEPQATDDREAGPGQSSHLEGVLHGTAATHESDGFTELVDQLQGFAPGSGLLEEEVMDEDEYDFDPIHAHAEEHDLEDLEEETLHGEDEHEDDELPVEAEHLTLRMDNVHEENAHEHEDEEEDAAAFALEEVEDEDEAAPLAVGEPQRRERPEEDRGRRGGGRNGRKQRGGPGSGGGRRQSAQLSDLPVISDLLKQGQEILVQIAKEPIAKKGARITSHIALPGRFLVFMPTVHHVGVSRKIASDEERQRLKRILISEKGENSGGFIVRTAADGASEEELRADLRFLISLWTEIKQRSETAKAPALIYHDLNLVERVLRDQVSSNFSAIWVDTEQEYERIVRFLNRFQPSLVRRVKLYTKETPLFEHFGIQEEISKALKSKVWLKSGGSIVINQTEALVAIDINTGKYVGKTARLEDTIVKTNLDAIPEIVRQIRLRDLGGIIVIDFIDMDDRKNRNRVLAALEEAMKVDRAPSKVLQFNDFGLVAITRKRVKQSLERTLSVTCDTCAGTGMVKSPITVCNEIFIELRKMQKHLDGKDVMLRVNPEVVKQLKGGGGRWINEYEEMVGKTIIIKSDPSLHPEQFDIQ